MAYEIIRISCQNESTMTRLIIEGKLAGACVDELAKCWQQSSVNGVSLFVDLTSVSYVDDRGKQLLKSMHDNGVKLFSRRLLSKCLIEEMDAAS